MGSQFLQRGLCPLYCLQQPTLRDIFVFMVLESEPRTLCSKASASLLSSIPQPQITVF